MKEINKLYLPKQLESLVETGEWIEDNSVYKFYKVLDYFPNTRPELFDFYNMEKELPALYNMREKGLGEESQEYYPGNLLPNYSIPIAYLGSGTDSYVVLDYRDDIQSPFVSAYVWNLGKYGLWVKLSNSFSEFWDMMQRVDEREIENLKFGPIPEDDNLWEKLLNWLRV